MDRLSSLRYQNENLIIKEYVLDCNHLVTDVAVAYSDCLVFGQIHGKKIPGPFKESGKLAGISNSSPVNDPGSITGDFLLKELISSPFC